MRKALITGGAGFIGSHVVADLLSRGWDVTVVDNFDPFYKKEIKLENLRGLLADGNIRFVEADIQNMSALQGALSTTYDVIVHLAAKAGVRPSIKAPADYVNVNIAGTQNLLEFAKRCAVTKFVFASSSSVYGVNAKVPWSEDDQVLLPISPYAATKVSGEMLGHVYSHLYGITFVALRFFTVYGPRQRPDLAIHRFARLMLNNQPIPIFGDGSSRRDYTFIDDIVRGVRSAIDYSGTRYEVINLGNSLTVSLLEMVQVLESALGIKAKLEHKGTEPGDVPLTYADIHKAKDLLGYEPSVSFVSGIHRFVSWLLANRSAPYCESALS